MKASARRRKFEALQAQALFVRRSHREIERLTTKGGDVPSKHAAKIGHRHCRADREARLYTSGFKGDIEVGNINNVIIGVSMKAWIKKKP